MGIRVVRLTPLGSADHRVLLPAEHIDGPQRRDVCGFEEQGVLVQQGLDVGPAHLLELCPWALH